jgi:hypothetical protein
MFIAHRFELASLKNFVFTLMMLTPTGVFAGVIGEAEPLTAGLANVLDFLLLIVGIVAIIGLVVAAALYFSAAGDMRQLALAKKATLGSITGIVIALGGYTLVRTLGAFFAP